METFASKQVNWRIDALPAPTQKALGWLAKQAWLKKTDWYLAGGTAMALQVGNRSSVDLDFFTPQKDFNAGKLLARFPSKDWKTTLLKEGTIYGELFGAKVSFIAYPFFVSANPNLWYGNVRVLEVTDIAVMKMVAISQRGKKRDFFDLYWYVKNKEPLRDVFLRLRRQYPETAHNYHHIVKSLAYFADAEDDPEPKLFFSASWKEVKRFLSGEAKKLMETLL